VPAKGWRGWVGQRVVRLTAAADRTDGEPAAPLESMPPKAPRVSEDRPALTGRRQRRGEGSRAGVVAKLKATGLDGGLVEAIAERLTESECRALSETALRRALTAELHEIAASDADYAPYEVFVGPPGVGKTTTIAKIAAQARAIEQRTVNLVAADAFRAGAIEQLRSYAEIVSSPFRVARTTEELDAALAASRHPTLVDTAGRAPSEDPITGLFHLLEHKRDVRTHLVLAADTSASSARRILDRYASVKPSRVVITKLDETDSVMPLIGAVRERGLPVSYLTAGQRIPEDLRRATPAVLAAVLLREPAMEERTCH
jgi:flagellar biosynthesis protein FlhF